MKAENVIHYRLNEYSGVTAIVSTRIYPVALPQAPTYPCITFKLISSRRVQGVHEKGGYAYVTIQVNCFSRSYEDLKSLVEQVRIALDRYGSSVTGTSINGVTVYDIVIGSESENYEPDLDLFAHSMDFEVLHAE